MAMMATTGVFMCASRSLSFRYYHLTNQPPQACCRGFGKRCSNALEGWG